MAFEVKLPDIGEGVAEGEIVRWMVKPGDAVKEHQPMVEVMTDKASVEIPAPRTGTIKALHAQEGEVVPVGTVIVSIDVDGADAPAAVAAPEHAAGAAKATTAAAVRATSAARTRVQATPAVRQLAQQLGVALEGIAGSGPEGAVTADDVRRAAEGGPAKAAAPAKTAPATPSGETRVPLRGLRRKIAEHMRHSLDTAAHFTFVAECDMTAVVEHREWLLPRARKAGVPLTYLAYLVKALIEPLRKYPLLNASLDDEKGEVVIKPDIHVGIATATEEGLMVPVIHEADRRTLLEIAVEIHRLARGAREGKLEVRELQGGTFTVTSTGARGGLLATPILHHPQVAILGVHEVKKKPAVVDGQIVARDMTNLSLSLDHRVVDGAVGADFLYEVIARLQHPEAWLTPEAIG
ncbi:MAG TPA: dihydrolipoamide acetyltransferase family protein [Candidatus Eisenbacteria bacterium]|nr:dihydrolipoamide acetyltransferase family protein [Candidatus Eisenbacteria bacterium]